MARKKAKKSSNAKQTPNSYISSGKARLLPLGDCYINAHWKEVGLANIIVSRKHITGNITYGVYLIDLLWKGVADTNVQFNVPADDLSELFGAEVELIPIDYNTAHNIIYGAEAFAADFEIKAHRDFELSRMILEEDDDRIPIIDIEFGKDGKPFKIIRMDDQDDDEDYDDEDYEYADEDNHPYFGGGGNHKNSHDVSPGNQTSATIYDWRQQIFDSDPTPLLSGWTRSKWEDFIKDPKKQLPGDPFVDQVLLYIFDKCYPEKNAESELDWQAVVKRSENELYSVTTKPLRWEDYEPSLEEQNLVLECLLLVENGDTPAIRKHYKQQIQKLLAAIERWPGNPQLYYVLQNIYALSDEDQKLEELLKRTATLFPRHLFGLVNYSFFLLKEGKSALVPSIMSKAYNITDFYPGRSEFQVSEIFSFNQVWFEYFRFTTQLDKARHYRIQLRNNVPPEYNGMKELRESFEKFDSLCRLTMKSYISQASNDTDFRNKMIDLLMAYS